MPHNIHNLMANLYAYMGFSEADLSYTWEIFQTHEGTTALLEFKLRPGVIQAPPYVRLSQLTTRIRVSALPDQVYFVEDNHLFKGHDLTRMMNWLVQREIALYSPQQEPNPQADIELGRL